MTTATGHQPPRKLIPAGFVFSYTTIRLVPENGWGPSALVGLILFLLILCGPWVIRKTVRGYAEHRAAQRRAEAKAAAK